MVGDVCTVVVSSVTVGLVVLTDTVVGPWVDVLTSGEVVVDCTEVGVCVTTVVPVVGDVCSVVVSSVTVGLVVLTDTVVGPWIDVVTSVPVVVGGCFGVVLELTVVVPVGFVPAVAVRGFVPPVDTEVVPVKTIAVVV